MAPRILFSDIERAAILLMATIMEYPARKLTELLLPFILDCKTKIPLGLDVLEKRIDRLLISKRLEYGTRRNCEPGTYVLHRLTIKHAGGTYYLLLIIEKYSGMVFAKAYTKIVVKSLRSTLALAVKIFNLPCKHLIIVTYDKFDSDLHLVETAEVVNVSIDKLESQRSQWLPSHLINVPIERCKISSDRIMPIVLPAFYNGTQALNTIIYSLVDKYNQVKRECFPRSRGLIVPVDRLFLLLKEKAKRNRKPITQWDSYLQNVTFSDYPVAEADRFEIYGGKPKLQFRARL